jgi:branched-chain amino acid transport system ATP-binding protein
MALLELRNVTKAFGGIKAVNDVSLEVEKDSIHGLIGPNGAGKTTIFNLITGIYKVSSGTIVFEDKNIQNSQTFKIAGAGITRTFQNIRLFKKLTVYENILTACHYNVSYNLLHAIFRTGKYSREEKMLMCQAEELMDILGLKDRRDFLANNLPYGLQRRLEIARALALRPKLLLLDEPAAGMNPEETEKLMGLIGEIRDKFKLTIFLIEHHMDLVMGICDRITVLNFGCKLDEGNPSEVQNSSSVKEAYLGEE